MKLTDNEKLRDLVIRAAMNGDGLPDTWHNDARRILGNTNKAVGRLIEAAKALRRADERFEGEMPVKYFNDLYAALAEVENGKNFSSEKSS